MKDVLRTLFFFILFGVGTGALALATLSNDIDTYYRQRRALVLAEVHLDTLRKLNADYDGLLEQIESEPNNLERLIPVVMGKRPEEPNTAFPEARLSTLMRAKQALASYQQAPHIPEIPAWLERIRNPKRRRGLFASGGALVLIALIWFGIERRRPASDELGVRS